jgi:hypothetical protein
MPNKRVTPKADKSADDMITFTRRLLNVSKTEVNEIRKQQKAGKKKR